MSKIDNGGNAFPLGASEYGGYGPDPGMSLRDWFAGQAIGAIIERCGGDTRARHEHLHDYFARKAYEISDALLMARASSSSIQEKSDV